MIRFTRGATQSKAILALTLALAGCAAQEEIFFLPGLDRERVLRINLRPDVGNLLRDANFYIRPSTVKVGSRVRITQYARREIRLLIEDKPYRMVPYSEIAFPCDPAGIDGFLAKYFLDSSERLQIDSLGPSDLTQDVLKGVPRIGMTKEQVYACLGPPLKIGGGKTGLSLTRDEILASDQWIYGHQILVIAPISTTYYFGDGRLQRLQG